MRKMNQRERRVVKAGRNLAERIKEYVKDNEFKYSAYIDIYYIGVDWVGSYGRVGELNMGPREIIWDDCLNSSYEKKKSAGLLDKRSNQHFYIIDGDDYITGVVVFSSESSFGRFGHYRTPIIKMENGQLYDCENLYWFTVKDSKELLSDLERGYNYFDPQEFFRDSFDCNEARLLQSDLTKFEAEKYEGGEWKNLGRISVREFWNIMNWVSYIKVGDVVYSYDDYHHELNRDSFDPDKSYSFNEYDDYEEEEL